MVCLSATGVSFSYSIYSAALYRVSNASSVHKF